MARPTKKNGIVLPMMNSSGRDRGDHDLLERADLALAHNGEQGEFPIITSVSVAMTPGTKNQRLL